MKTALLITTESDSEYGHVYCRFVFAESGKVRNYQTSWDSKPYQYYDDLYVSCQISKGDNPTSYGWTVEYRDKVSVTLNKAEKMAKTLKSIVNKLGTINNKFGEPESYGQFVVNVANAVKATDIIEYKRQAGWSYDDCDFSFRSLSDGKRFINNLVNDIHTELNPQVEAA